MILKSNYINPIYIIVSVIVLSVYLYNSNLHRFISRCLNLLRLFNTDLMSYL